MSSHEREITFAEPLLTAPCTELSHQAALIREEAGAVAHNVLQKPAPLVLGHPFGLASPRPSLLKLMRITGLDRRFLISGLCPAGCSS